MRIRIILESRIPHPYQSEKPGAVEAHSETIEAHPGDVEAHNGGSHWSIEGSLGQWLHFRIVLMRSRICMDPHQIERSDPDPYQCRIQIRIAVKNQDPC
jgi:hypothetical protein